MITLSAIAQLNMPCSRLSLDTIYGNYVVEQEANARFYVNGHTMIQSNLIYSYDKNSNLKVQDVYASDSVFAISLQIPNGYKYRNCANLDSITNFLVMTDFLFFPTRKIRKNIKKNTIKTKTGARFTYFKAKLIVLKVVDQKLKIPKVYSKTTCLENSHFEYCEKMFSNLFLILSIEDFSFVNH